MNDFMKVLSLFFLTLVLVACAKTPETPVPEQKVLPSSSLPAKFTFEYKTDYQHSGGGSSSYLNVTFDGEKIVSGYSTKESGDHTQRTFCAQQYVDGEWKIGQNIALVTLPNGTVQMGALPACDAPRYGSRAAIAAALDDGTLKNESSEGDIKGYNIYSQ